jgi:hypothetical protein
MRGMGTGLGTGIDVLPTPVKLEDFTFLLIPPGSMPPSTCGSSACDGEAVTLEWSTGYSW